VVGNERGRRIYCFRIESDRKIEAFKQETRENFQAVRQDIVSMNDKFPSNYIFDQLAQKVSLLEDQVNKKKR
jgi:hypothetical protein